MADQELFDGEIKTVIEDNENLSFRKANPASAGSRVISWANFKLLLSSLFVSLTQNQVINGIKQFISSPTVPDPTTDLQAVNLRTLNLKTTAPEFIDFVPQSPAPSYLIGRMYYDADENTWTLLNDLEGTALQLGEELRARLINDTGFTLLNGVAVSVTGAVGASLQVELMDASKFDSSIRGFGLITLEAVNGAHTYAVRYGAVRDMDTSSFVAGDIIYGDPSTPGGLINTRPDAPNYPVVIGVCIISDAVNGIIGVDTRAFNGSDTSLNIEGAINGMATQAPDISFDASSGDIIATVTNEAFPTKKLPFLIGGMRYLLDTITSPLTIIIPPGLSSTETEESILYIKLNAGVPELAVTTATTISEPFAILSTQTVFNAARTNSDGKPLSYRRYNDAMDSKAEGVDGAYGLINVITNWIRLRGGAGWTSGQDATPNVDDANIKLEMTAGVGGQLHRANLPLFDGNNYLIYNDIANAITYEPSANLTDITETSAGVTLLNNNVYYPIKLYYLLNSNGVGNDVIATRPSGFYTTEDEAKSDALKYGTSLADPKTELNSYAIYTMVIGRIGGGGATITLIELQNNRKRTLKGDEGGGGAGGAEGTDDKVRVSATDTTNSYLDDKLAEGSGITKSTLNPGANEQLALNLGGDLSAAVLILQKGHAFRLESGDEGISKFQNNDESGQIWTKLDGAAGTKLGIIAASTAFSNFIHDNGYGVLIGASDSVANSFAGFLMRDGRTYITRSSIASKVFGFGYLEDFPDIDWEIDELLIPHQKRVQEMIDALTKLDKVTTSDQSIVSNVEFLGQAHANNESGTIKTFSATPTFDFDDGNDQEMTLTGNVSAFATSNSEGSANYKVWLINDSTAGRTVATPTGWTKAASSDDHVTAASAINLYQFFTRPGGQKYYSILNM